ncbi:MAG: DUF2970 domain-containing protein [Betaproteobacteria bacterium]|nr:DUF2970 domain-containing protein [Betaproteobacteria bacterium]MBI2959832.1 DUF2970 domain-containing protein [Betaproteobacteria bacterium]
MMRGEKRSRAASARELVAAVLAAFFGVRRHAAHEALQFNPVHLIAVGLMVAALFVVGLVLLVKFIVIRAA